MGGTRASSVWLDVEVAGPAPGLEGRVAERHPELGAGSPLPSGFEYHTVGSGSWARQATGKQYEQNYSIFQAALPTMYNM